jgi:hypothetical protein
MTAEYGPEDLDAGRVLAIMVGLAIALMIVYLAVAWVVVL